MVKIEQVAVEKLKLNAKEKERHNDPEATRRLGENMKARGQLQNIGITEDYDVLYGTGRVMASLAVGIKMVTAQIYPASMTGEERALARLSENLQRSDYTQFQKFERCVELGKLLGLNGKELAERLQYSPSAICQLMSPLKCIPNAVEAFKEGKITTADCYALSKLSAEDQEQLLERKLAGTVSSAEMKQSGRKRRASATPAVRTSKIPIRMPGGVTLTATGEGLSLEELIEALATAMKMAKKAAEQGLDSKTAVRVWADMAAAG